MTFLLLMVLLAYIALMSRPLAKASLAGADVPESQGRRRAREQADPDQGSRFERGGWRCSRIAFMTGFGIEARGIRFVPREAVRRRVEERRR
jgi:hypothetical protein